MKTIVQLVWLVIFTLSLQTQSAFAENPYEKSRAQAVQIAELMPKPFIERISKEYHFSQDEKGFVNIQMVLDGPDGEQITATYVSYGQIFGLSFNIREKNGDLIQIGDIGMSGRVNIGETIQYNGISNKTFYLQCLDAERLIPDEESSVGTHHGEHYQEKYQRCLDIFLEKMKKAQDFFKSSKFNPVTTG